MSNRLGEARWRNRHGDVDESYGDKRWQIWRRFESTDSRGEDVNLVAEDLMNRAVCRRE